jgi:hypothetical protein
MTTFVALYRGRTITSARLIALSADPVLVADVSARLLQERASEDCDPILDCVERGRKDALRLITRETSDVRP